MEAERNLSIERVYETYVVSFYNDEIYTTVTSDCDTIARWINEIEHPNLFIVGFDLCVGSRCLIYQLEYVDYDYPDVLLNFLANEEYTFVG
ncbi:hypothetical protein CDL12_29882 [Handroanthus impetiginosus]|uniref:Uncharacterized protein n=1 Tax=Handroanthus impetiginosus TaxID=429701 RepID=A0A2G9FX66_9LAMI|nr:hypothetical protein CDL12_29882 [Handroanthus impetiginosus]